MRPGGYILPCCAEASPNINHNVTAKIDKMLRSAWILLAAGAAHSAAGGWIDHTQNAQLGDVGGQVVAFGDFNADRRTDLFVREGSSVVVYLAEEKTFSRSSAACSVPVRMSAPEPCGN